MPVQKSRTTTHWSAVLLTPVNSDTYIIPSSMASTVPIHQSSRDTQENAVSVTAATLPTPTSPQTVASSGPVQLCRTASTGYLVSHTVYNSTNTDHFCYLNCTGANITTAFFGWNSQLTYSICCWHFPEKFSQLGRNACHLLSIVFPLSSSPIHKWCKAQSQSQLSLREAMLRGDDIHDMLENEAVDVAVDDAIV